MSDYRAYRTDPEGHIRDRIEFVAANDAAAMEHARRYMNGHSVEVWELGRRVGAISAGQDGPARAPFGPR